MPDIAVSNEQSWGRDTVNRVLGKRHERSLVAHRMCRFCSSYRPWNIRYERAGQPLLRHSTYMLVNARDDVDPWDLGATSTTSQVQD